MLISVDNLRKQYGSVNALDGVSFEVEKGEWLALMGPSGSGKTTLLNILGGLDSASSGQVTVDGEDVASLAGASLASFRARKVGFVFQQFHLVPYLTALENVMLAQYFHSMTDQGEARRALERVGLGERADHLPKQLSGGEQQRVAVARALINEPAILLADEPTGNLDAANEQIVLELFESLRAQGHTIVMVTHDEDVGNRADRRMDLKYGRIVQMVSPRSFEQQEEFDEVLEHLWMDNEEFNPHGEPAHTFTPNQLKRLHRIMIDMGLLWRDAGQIAYTAAGEARARSVIRRHRLSERLFMDTLKMRDEVQLEETACTFEHILSPEATERICTYLGHPTTCPHGSPIPPGECCPK
jgi:putative ABC transport system ATP-binding protein